MQNIKSGQYHSSENKKHDLIIVLVHHLGGEPEQLKYHVQFLTQNGFDVYTYPAFLHGKDHWRGFLPALKKNKKAVLEIWAEELEQHLKSLPGLKIIFSFSFPSACVFLLIPKRKDIKALICDGGPFMNFPLMCWRLLTHYHGVSNVFLKIHLMIKMNVRFKCLFVGKRLKHFLSLIPKGFPILSLQAEQDKQVPPVYINKFLELVKQADIIVCRLKKSAHLKGLKTERELYIKNVLKFLNKEGKS